MNRLLVVLDGSPADRAALETGLELAWATGALTTFACVRAEPPRRGGAPDELGRTRELRRARALIDRACARAAASGVEAESEILAGAPVTSLSELARQRAVELIVVGAGAAVARGLVAQADCSVLLVKTPLWPSDGSTVEPLAELASTRR